MEHGNTSILIDDAQKNCLDNGSQYKFDETKINFDYNMNYIHKWSWLKLEMKHFVQILVEAKNFALQIDMSTSKPKELEPYYN